MMSIKEIIAENLTRLRKNKKLTQLELAERFNYSDKAISKWERGEALPDVEVLINLAKFYNVGLEDLTKEHAEKKVVEVSEFKENRNKIIIALLSVSLVWILATLSYVYVKLITNINYWMMFLWALPVSFIVLTVFNAIWGKRKFNFIITSLLVWSIILCIFLTLLNIVESAWLVFLIGAPLQVAIILWSGLKSKKKKV